MTVEGRREKTRVRVKREGIGEKGEGRRGDERRGEESSSIRDAV